MTQFTVLGAAGFIGSHLCRRLQQLQMECFAPARDAELGQRNLGTVIYCIGLTADFRSRPLDTIEAHVCKLHEVLSIGNFDSLLYLSSTRLYRGNTDTGEEASVTVNSSHADDLYNLSKLAGESLALNSGRTVRVARLSNVYGGDFDSQNFVSDVLREALLTRRVILNTSPESAKDYVSIDDVVDVLIKIARSGVERIYNVASGTNVTNGELTEGLQKLISCEVEVANTATQVSFPAINIDRIRGEFDFRPSSILDDLETLVEVYRRQVTTVVQ